MTFAIAPHPPRPIAAEGRMGLSLLSRLRGALRRGAAVARRGRSRRALTGVPDHLLRDIGLTRAEIEHLDL